MSSRHSEYIDMIHTNWASPGRSCWLSENIVGFGTLGLSLTDPTSNFLHSFTAFLYAEGNDLIKSAIFEWNARKGYY